MTEYVMRAMGQCGPTRKRVVTLASFSFDFSSAGGHEHSTVMRPLAFGQHWHSMFVAHIATRGCRLHFSTPLDYWSPFELPRTSFFVSARTPKGHDRLLKG